MKSLTCQSCGLPFSKKFRGTNKDLSKNSDYCLNCFKDGTFTNHQLNIQDMEKKLLEMARHHDGLTLEEAQQTIKILPDLKRWKMTHIL
ncbi:zinc ribbon domain-containing protein [Salinimicrobium sp. MT39]|uniref:Zinc ribbon domain-containing protein n=1 Tax=Salinimicrobium profundisediminis TaxID=2994553 RepID=A0A9X3I2L2_9FLAO|nr:zinc ribbon domain-containing protein [Salinimicrobium profundisediminis]MCX2839764.1 zinc ribbon domain-containing protein [Salinimicrobium profundisediminis]